MPFGICNAPATFQHCMITIFHELIEDSMEVFMDDFSVFGSSFDHCLKNLEKMLKRCEETNLVLNWENSISWCVAGEEAVKILRQCHNGREGITGSPQPQEKSSRLDSTGLISFVMRENSFELATRVNKPGTSSQGMKRPKSTFRSVKYLTSGELTSWDHSLHQTGTITS
ncbi:reverse transcriptase domain-containing protein [Tanacetum coccineum]